MNEKLNERINVLVKWGEVLRSDKKLDDILAKTSSGNPWFTVDFCRNAIDAVTERMLSRERLEQWLLRYEIPADDRVKTVSVIMAGNIPLVGFHDFLCVYISGHNIKIKLSGKDEILFPYVYEKLLEIDPAFRKKSAIVGRLEGFDAVIATGSNNTNRYFEYYFRDYPKILRRNRNSVAILNGEETDEDLQGLADDIFMYFGLGCRNVSKLYLPEAYDITRLFPYFGKYKWMHNHTKYMNNYDYNRTLLLMNKTPHLANEIIMFQENISISSPVSILHYELYKNVKLLEAELAPNMNDIQCIVASKPIIFENLSIDIVKFGNTQKPELGEYADDVDTLSFLLSLKSLQ